VKACIAVVEDEPEILDLLRVLLESSNYTVAAIDHPDRVHEVVQQVCPDVFLLDLMLPGISGIDLARLLRANGCAQTPMIAMYASRYLLDKAMASQLFQASLRKPFDVITVVECVERHIQGRAVSAS